jgi:hypothetical protein
MGSSRDTAWRLFQWIVPAIFAIFCGEALAIGPDNYGYTATTTTFAFEDLTVPGITATGILDNANDVAVVVPIGFPFTFYGKTYTSLYVSTNGLITFGNADVDRVPVNLTTSGPQNNLPSIAVLWHDWTFQYFGSDEAYYATLGPAGNRRLIIQWNFTQSFTGPGTDTVTFQAKLFEGSNNIEFHYYDATVEDDVNVSNGKNATVGIRDIGGQTSNRNLQWSFNQAVITDGLAIQFAAPVFEIWSIQRTGNGHMLLQCVGEPNVANTIQVSTDLVHFNFLASVIADSLGNFPYEDMNAGTPPPRRFYRLSLQ